MVAPTNELQNSELHVRVRGACSKASLCDLRDATVLVRVVGFVLLRMGLGAAMTSRFPRGAMCGRCNDVMC